MSYLEKTRADFFQSIELFMYNSGGSYSDIVKRMLSGKSIPFICLRLLDLLEGSIRNNFKTGFCEIDSFYEEISEIEINIFDTIEEKHTESFLLFWLSAIDDEVYFWDMPTCKNITDLYNEYKAMCIEAGEDLCIQDILSEVYSSIGYYCYSFILEMGFTSEHSRVTMCFSSDGVQIKFS